MRSVRRIHALVFLFTYFHSFFRAYITVYISKTVRATVNINGLYKIVHWLSIAAKMYDLQSLSEIQGH